MANTQLRTYSVPTVIVPAIKVASFNGGSAGTFAVAAVGADDRILYVTSFSTYVDALSATSGVLPVPITALGDAYNKARSSSSASVVGAGVVGLDYSTTSRLNIVTYVDSDGATIS